MEKKNPNIELFAVYIEVKTSYCSECNRDFEISCAIFCWRRFIKMYFWCIHWDSRALKMKSSKHLTTFFMSTWWVDCKNMQIFFSWCLFELIHIIRFEMHMNRQDKYIKKIISILFQSLLLCFCYMSWLKITFVCFQLQLLNTMQGLNPNLNALEPHSALLC